MITVEFRNDCRKSALDEHPFLSDISKIERLFAYAYLSSEVSSPLKDKDMHNEKEHFVSLLITDDEKIKELNKEYRNIDSPTDVLSFPQDDETVFGDIVISLDTLLRNADELKVSPKDEYFRLLLHSFLHLLGYDHASNDFENEPMLLLQEKILHNFQKV